MHREASDLNIYIFLIFQQIMVSEVCMWLGGGSVVLDTHQTVCILSLLRVVLSLKTKVCKQRIRFDQQVSFRVTVLVC